MPWITDKSCYLHPRKCGGTYVRTAMRRGGLGPRIAKLPDGRGAHLTAAESAQWMDGRFSFTFVRHPQSYLRSWFVSRVKEGWRPLRDPSDELLQCRATTFERFVGRYLDLCRGAVGRIFESYTDGVDFVGRVERFPLELCDALLAAGESCDWDRLRATEPQRVDASGRDEDPVLALSDQMADRLADAESRAMNRYDYAHNPRAITT